MVETDLPIRGGWKRHPVPTAAARMTSSCPALRGRGAPYVSLAAQRRNIRRIHVHARSIVKLSHKRSVSESLDRSEGQSTHYTHEAEAHGHNCLFRSPNFSIDRQVEMMIRTSPNQIVGRYLPIFPTTMPDPTAKSDITNENGSMRTPAI